MLLLCSGRFDCAFTKDLEADNGAPPEKDGDKQTLPQAHDFATLKCARDSELSLVKFRNISIYPAWVRSRPTLTLTGR